MYDVGCIKCITDSEHKCPHHEKLKPLTDAIDEAASRIANKIIHNSENVKPDIKTKAFFEVMRLIQKNGFNPRDVEYWKAKGWTGKKRPWK